MADATPADDPPPRRRLAGAAALAVGVLAAVLMAAAAAVGMGALGSVANGQRLVTHTIEVQLQTERLRTDLRGMGRAALDALASPSALPGDLAQRQRQTRDDLARLQALVADNPAQARAAHELVAAFDGHMFFLARLRPDDAALAERRERAEALEARLGAFMAEEARLLQQRQAALAESLRGQALAIAVLAALAVLLLLAGAATWRQLVRQRERTAAAAQRSQALEDARGRLEALARQLLTVEEHERRALARELHDDLGQRLAALKMNLQIGQAALAVPPPMLGEAVRIADDCIAQVRQRAFSLRPVPLDGQGLAAALRTHVQQQAQLAGVHASVEVALGGWRPPEAWADHVFRIVQESVRNALEHGRPQRLAVSIVNAHGECALEIVDDGVGLAGHGRPGGMGLLNMRERCELLGGRFEIGPAEPRGTRVHCRWPTEAEHREG